MRKYLRHLANYPWQPPVFGAVTIYGITQYGWLSWKVIVMGAITIFFTVLTIIDYKRKKQLRR
ncbi:hypothetical protein HZC30_04660 [Candidatus Woesearchaeota archaeon]|nr:hypothetical protein [Candidatus Woesearchaeota archaeon]